VIARASVTVTFPTPRAWLAHVRAQADRTPQRALFGLISQSTAYLNFFEPRLHSSFFYECRHRQLQRHRSAHRTFRARRRKAKYFPCAQEKSKASVRSRMASRRLLTRRSARLCNLFLAVDAHASGEVGEVRRLPIRSGHRRGKVR